MDVVACGSVLLRDRLCVGRPWSLLLALLGGVDAN